MPSIWPCRGTVVPRSMAHKLELPSEQFCYPPIIIGNNNSCITSSFSQLAKDRNWLRAIPYVRHFTTLLALDAKSIDDFSNHVSKGMKKQEVV